jgi:bifunctional non-homologous end joining protein LigD
MTPARTADEVAITHADRALFPDGTTKGELADYYRAVAATMLPHLRGRPLMLQRFPRGIDQAGFYQKDVDDQLPSWIRTVEVEKQGGVVRHAVCDDEASLLYLVNLDCVTFHTWLSLAAQPQCPDRMIFDLDPTVDDFAAVRDAALALRELLDELELTSFVQTTGSRGLHVVIPLDGADEFSTVRAIAREIAAVLVHRSPDQLTIAAHKARRGQAIYVDVQRNGYAQTAVAPYSVRARGEASVATPLRWDELGRTGLTAASYTVRNLRRRLAQLADPWAEIGERPQSLRRVRDRLERIVAG